jgi:hypothetical protein
LFLQGNMDLDTSNKKKDEWSKQHLLTKDQVKQLIENKLRRAAKSHESLKKREMLCGDR